MDTTITTIMADSSAFSLASFFAENWGELVLIGLAAFKAVLNLLPSDKPVQVFAYLDSLINFLISDHINNDEE
tara:strand:- start:322 stop:540 length:219 start_codon:yes stop_codon:yes gene_type:complete